MSDFIQKIHQWYTINSRDLPWRQTSDPYKIWLSEIILQQTRVSQGINYYLKFVGRFPTVQQLGNAKEDEVLKLWQGLGYYSRARNIHSTAKYVSEKLNGKFPENYNGLLTLKGIGPYTAAAIASIAFDLPHATLDGNIYRVFARYFGIHTPIDSSQGKKEFSEVAQSLVPDKGAGFHNQALMEFGALQCVPKSPVCEACPVCESCYAVSENEIDKLPVKAKQTKQRIRYFYYFLFEAGEQIFLEKRSANDIWKNLFQLPLVETQEEVDPEEILKNNSTVFLKECNAEIKHISAQKKHVLSHQIIYARLIHITIEDAGCIKGNYLLVDKKDISKFAVPRLIEHFLYDNKIY